ncbi:MAG: DUF4136 domain-containing protein [Gammaproteobacteria bacterium]|nr:DUF4136 domain-containing protein [Gammaproteobacteria bacterium]
MKKVLSFLLIGLAIFSSGCSSVSVRTDYDPEYDFSTFKTYRWANANELNPDDVLAKNPLAYKRVQDAVNNTLEEKGRTLVESDDADFVVHAHAGVKERIQVYNTGFYGGYGGWYDPWWGSYGGTNISHYEEGTLVIDIIHWENKKLAWRGTGAAILSGYRDSERMQKNIDAMVAKTMADFPPGAAKQ